MKPATYWRSQPAMGSVDKALAPGRPTLPPFAEIDPDDWDLVVSTRRDVLLYGPSSVLDVVLSALRPHLRRPIHRWLAGSRTPLPSRSAETLLLEHLDVCPMSEQQQLLNWLNEADPRLQVISTTNQLLFDQVQGGIFLADLYYHLNLVYLDVSKSA